MDDKQYPLYNTTYHIYRVSPLFNTTTPILSSLSIHARRLRDSLISLPLTTTATSGPFKSCNWSLLGDEEAWGRIHNSQNQDEEEDEISTIADLSAAEAVGVLVEIIFERHTYKAILLGDKKAKSSIPGFTTLPLLLINMPVALKESFISYLSTAFDARVSGMPLRTVFLSGALEGILAPIVTRHEQDLVEVSSFPRGVTVTLAFPSTSPELKNISVAIPQGSLVRMYQQGRERWSSEKKERSKNVNGPFMCAFSLYVREYMALDFDHPAVTVGKIELGPFAMAAEGRIKITVASDEARMLWRALLAEAAREKLLSKEQVIKAAEKRLSAVNYAALNDDGTLDDELS